MSFILKNNSANKSLIVLSYSKGLKTPFRYSTGQSILVSSWDKANQRAVKNSKVNLELERYENHLNKIVNYAENQQIEITKEYLFNEFENEFKFKPREKVVNKKKSDFFEMIDVYINDSISGKRKTDKGTKITESRIKVYRTFKKDLALFRDKISIKDIDYNFYSEFYAWLTDKGLSVSSVGKDIKVFNSILRYTYKIGLHNNKSFESGDFKAFEELKENVYLHTEEIDILWKMQLIGNLEKVRDLFIIALYTGVRISDLKSFTKANIVKDGTALKVIQYKTKEIIYIPIHPRVNFLLKKYNGFPSPIPDQKMNNGIKILCEKAGFNEEQFTKKPKVERL